MFRVFSNFDIPLWSYPLSKLAPHTDTKNVDWKTSGGEASETSR